MKFMAIVATTLLGAAIACGPPPDDPVDAGVDAGETGPPWWQADLNQPLVSARPFGLRVPASYSGAPSALLVALHAFTSDGVQHASMTGLINHAESRGFLLAYPDGVLTYGENSWNASCCGYLPMTADDVLYLRALIADVASRYNVDRKQIYLQGLSNGAFMAHLLACQAADLIAAANTIAGTMWTGEQSACQPSEPVAMLHVHGTSDQTISYAGGAYQLSGFSFSHISASAVVELWRERNGCGAPATTRSADYEINLAGAETDAASYAEGCAAGRTVELWTINGGGHIPNVNTMFWEDVLDFLFAHAKE